MSLTSLPFIGTLLAVAVAAVVAVAMLAPHVSERRVSHVLSRIGLLVTCQVCALAALTATANAYFDFYNSWGDLLGVPSGADASGNPSDSTALPSRADGGRRSQSPAVTPVLRDPFISGHQPPAREGRLESVMINGATSGISTPAYLYLPPQYFEPRYRKQSFPVGVAFTGYPGNAQNLITHLHLPQTAAKEIGAGNVRPMILVMLRPMVTPPRDTECTDVPGGPQAETFFARDLPTAVTATYRATTRPGGWGLLGNSTGGYCAVRLAMRHSDRFTAAVSLSGYYHALQDLTTGDLYGGSAAYRQENDPLWRLQHLSAPPISALVTTSRAGERDYAETQRFVSLAAPPMHVSALVLPQGGHHFSVWRQELTPALRWFSAHLAP